MSPGRKIVATAERYIGVRETPDGSNRGPQIDEWQRQYGLLGQPWCAMFVGGIYKEAGVDDAGLIHPYTGYICDRARAGGHVGPAVPGAMIVWCGTHVGILAAPTSDPNVWHTIEGNSSNSVARRVRSLAGATIVTPPALLTDPEPLLETVYFFEDPGAEFKVYGPFARRSYAEKAKRAKGGEVKETGDGKYVLRVGQTRHFGPWVSKAGRDRSMFERSERTGRKLRPYSRRRELQPAGPAQAEDLGQTT